MKGLSNKKLWCHRSLKSNERYTNNELRGSHAKSVSTFRELVPIIARIANHNPEFSLFFRGQERDYKLNTGLRKNFSSFYPTIFRSPGKSLTAETLKNRFRILNLCASELTEKLESNDIEIISKIKKFPELQWSILQHYEVCSTPLLDVTHSLRVAASFALNNASKDAYLYVFAFPYPNGTISYFTEEELLNVKLLSACTSQALRPHFQEGFLIGTFPTHVTRKHPSLDLGTRLIAKFKLKKEGFWSKDFHAIPENALYPKDDEVELLCSAIKFQYGT